jgi:rhodanese-related sulfurtransferase
MSQDEAQIARGSRIPPLFLDVRTAGEFAEGHIPDAYNVPVGEVAVRIEEIIEEADGSPIVVYGEHGGGRAARAEAELVGAGLGQVLHLKGDMSAWRAAALPVETGAP